MRPARCSLLLLGVLACGDSGNGGGEASADGGGDPADAAAGADGSAAPDAGDGGAVDFVEPGPHAVEESSGTLELEGCALDYTLYAPEEDGDAPLVVLGHGFSRGQEQMAGVAEHLASYGVRVATPAYCHSSPLDADHQQNGRDAVSLSEALAEGAPVVHAGHSAGGLAALLAGTEDSATAAVLGLDLVDSDSLGAGAVGDLDAPLFGLVGEPSSCNEDGNALGLYDESGSFGARVVGATHCDFEDPTGSLCTGFCGGETEATPTIRALAAAYVTWQLGLEPSGEAWVTEGGARFEELVSAGILEPL